MFRFSAAEARKLCALYGYAASQQEALDLCDLAGGWAYLLDWVLHTHMGRPIAGWLGWVGACQLGRIRDVRG